MIDASFWTGLSFILFVALVFKPGKRALFTSLDARRDEITHDIMEAQSLYESAKKTLQEAIDKTEQTEQLIDDIKTHAAQEIQRLESTSLATLDANHAHRLASLANRAEILKNTIEEEIEHRVIDIAITALRYLAKEAPILPLDEPSLLEASGLLSEACQKRTG